MNEKYFNLGVQNELKKVANPAVNQPQSTVMPLVSAYQINNPDTENKFLNTAADYGINWGTGAFLAPWAISESVDAVKKFKDFNTAKKTINNMGPTIKNFIPNTITNAKNTITNIPRQIGQIPNQAQNALNTVANTARTSGILPAAKNVAGGTWNVAKNVSKGLGRLASKAVVPGLLAYNMLTNKGNPISKGSLEEADSILNYYTDNKMYKQPEWVQNATTNLLAANTEYNPLMQGNFLAELFVSPIIHQMTNTDSLQHQIDIHNQTIPQYMAAVNEYDQNNNPYKLISMFAANEDDASRKNTLDNLLAQTNAKPGSKTYNQLVNAYNYATNDKELAASLKEIQNMDYLKSKGESSGLPSYKEIISKNYGWLANASDSQKFDAAIAVLGKNKLLAANYLNYLKDADPEGAALYDRVYAALHDQERSPFAHRTLFGL